MDDLSMSAGLKVTQDIIVTCSVVTGLRDDEKLSLLGTAIVWLFQETSICEIDSVNHKNGQNNYVFKGHKHGQGQFLTYLVTIFPI